MLDSSAKVSGRSNRERDGRDERLGEVIEEFAAEIRSGHCPSLQQYAARYSDLSDELRPLLATILTMEGIKGEQARDAAGRVCLAGDVLNQLGDFRIIRELGKGGMGVVFEAEQLSLKRLVALKVLPRQMLLRPEDRERFQRESQLAAGLHHSNIVPVYGCGHEGGYHFYAMQLIKGVTLSKQQPDLSSGSTVQRITPRRLAEIGIQVADALAYAHDQGILHRDIKPANLIEDRNGRIWVTDFGLAHRDFGGRAGSYDGGGTERFIAPERRGGQCDRRADIFSLGVTLADLAAPPQEIREHSTASLPSAVLPALANQPPVRLDLPRDLDAIIRKAMAVDVGRRYQSAAEMAEDFRRYLGNRPVAARPLSVAGKFGKLLRRHPIGSATVTLLLVLSWTLAFIYQRSGVLAAQQNDKLARAFFTVDALLWSNTAGVEQLNQKRNRAKSAPLARWERTPALWKIFPVGEFNARFDAILKHLTSEGEFDTDFAISDEMFDCAVRARWHVANAQREIGNLDEARLALEYGLELADQARRRRKPSSSYMPVIFSARLRNDLAEIAEARLDFETADRYRRSVLKLLDASPPEEDDPSDLPERGSAHLGLGAVRPERVGLSAKWLPLDPQPPPPPIDRDAALEHIDRAVACCEEYCLVDDHSSKSITALAQALIERERLHRALGLDTGADERRALDMLEALAMNSPEPPDNRHAFADALAESVTPGPSSSGGDDDTRLQRLNRAYELAHSLSRSHPQRTIYLETKIDICHKLAELCIDRGDLAAADAHLDEAVRHQHDIVRRFPKRSRSRTCLALLQYRYSQLLERCGKTELSRKMRKQANRHMDSVPVEPPEQPFIASARSIVLGPSVHPETPAP